MPPDGAVVCEPPVVRATHWTNHVWATGNTCHKMGQSYASYRQYGPPDWTILCRPPVVRVTRCESHVWATGSTCHLKGQSCLNHRWHTPSDETVIYELLIVRAIRWDNMCEPPVVHITQRDSHVWATGVTRRQKRVKMCFLCDKFCLELECIKVNSFIPDLFQKITGTT